MKVQQSTTRFKHKERKMETRQKIILGGIVIKAGAGDLSEDELFDVLSNYMIERDKKEN